MHLLPKIEGGFILHTCDFCWLTSKTYDNLEYQVMKSYISSSLFLWSNSVIFLYMYESEWQSC